MASSDWFQPPSYSPTFVASMEPNQDQALQVRCPRCDSTETKFCYYNNYSLSQPRYFCRSCRRYWTKGGTLRNIPVGGVCRKNKKLSSISRKPDTTDHRRQTPDVNGNENTSLQLSYPESPAKFTEGGGVGGEYEGDGPFPAMVASGADTVNTHGLSLFGEMEHSENMRNEVDAKRSRVFAFEWQEQMDCHSDLYGSGEGRNGSFGY
ncbi:unnamed protein product [Lactuca virosa]|uniref:Dof zinc finger protein n=1 Tax=Lactuca virosa TaxID=75947 RepID=A0AAU9LXB9_9ASTR|nr:unnamed protein product [Lactuca virosa]